MELRSKQAYLADDFLNFSEAIKRHLPVFRRSNIENTSYPEILCFIGAMIHPKLPRDIFPISTEDNRDVSYFIFTKIPNERYKVRSDLESTGNFLNLLQKPYNAAENLFPRR